jgi:hypothetical protein
MARNTRTGGVLEAMILPALKQGGYAYKSQVNVGKRLGLGKHMVDAVAEKDGKSVLVSMKWQQVSGTAEQKVPYEIICLLEAFGIRYLHQGISGARRRGLEAPDIVCRRV